MTLQTGHTTGTYKLAPAEIEAFWRDGFVGPFPSGMSWQQARWFGDRYEAIVQDRTDHPVYGRYSQRDWHLVHTDLEAVMASEPIVQRVASLLGPDLLLWRSKLFHKAPGGDAIGWHQEWGQFDGEEIGNSVPSLRPADPDGAIWDVTIWIALDDIDQENGPLQFAAGSQGTRFAWRHVPMTESAFYENPFAGLDKAEIARRTARGELLLDIDTADWLDGYDLDSATRQDVIDHLERRFEALSAKFTDFAPDPGSLRTVTMAAGDFVIFSERTMHGSPANLSERRRTAVNCRITRADTLVYPGRLTGDLVDGSNLDISRHTCILVSGKPAETRNVWRAPNRGA